MLSAFALTSMLFSSCSTDLDINAPYKEFVIVFGMIDQSVDTQWVKINKSFLGDGSAFDDAQIRDSSEYANEDLVVEVQEWQNGSMVGQPYPLQDTVVDHREPGIFFYPDQKVYYFVEPNIDQDSEYRIVGTAKGNEFSGESVVVNDFQVSRPNPFTGSINMASSLGNYVEYDVRWKSAKNGKRYEVSYVLRWNEVTDNGSEEKSISRGVATRRSSSTNGGEDLEGVIGGEDFYKHIANNVPEDPNVVRREFLGLDFIFVTADEILNTYMDLNDPITGIVQERPSFTNINNGLGIFASRHKKIVADKSLNVQSLVELTGGQYTGNLKFCSPDPGHSGLSYGCF